MKISRITELDNPVQIRVKVVLDTARIKGKCKSIYERIEEINETIDNKINKLVDRIYG